MESGDNGDGASGAPACAVGLKVLSRLCISLVLALVATSCRSSPPAAPSALAVVAEQGTVVVDVAGTDLETCAVLDDGSVRCTDVSPWRSASADVPRLLAPTRPVAQVAVAGCHVCWRLRDGSVECTRCGGTEPVVIPLPPATHVAVAPDRACALAQDGLWCWSDAGDVAATPRLIEGTAGAVSAALGWGHTCAVSDDGQVLCWGSNERGQTGATAQDDPIAEPRPVAGVSDARRVSAGYGHTCAVLRSGRVACWGDNSQGQLGDGCFERSDGNICVDANGSATRQPGRERSDVRYVEAIADATDVVAAQTHTCALRRTGSVACWGADDSGQLGDGWLTYRRLGPRGDGWRLSGREMNRVRPVEARGIFAAIGLRSAGARTCALRQHGAPWCWGMRPDEPLQVEGLGPVEKIELSSGHACALLRDHTVSCWGGAAHGQSGAPLIGPKADHEAAQFVGPDLPTPRRVADIEGATDLVVGRRHSCAVVDHGRVRCWGQWRADLVASDGAPEEVRGIDDAVQLAAGGTVGNSFTCARRSNETVACWGGGKRRSAGPRVDRDHATTLPGLQSVIDIAAGDGAACARERSGDVWCWGELLVLRDGQFEELLDATPRRVALLNSSGASERLVMTNGNVCGWGMGLLRCLKPEPVPRPHVAWPAAFTRSRTCGMQNSKVWCDSGRPVEFAPPAVRALHAQNDATCAALDDGRVYCWGRSPDLRGRGSDAYVPRGLW